MFPKRVFLRCCLAFFVVLLWQVPAMAAHAAGAAVTVNPQPPACAPADSTATANGSGYTAGQTIQIWVDQTQVTRTTPSTITVGSNGTWTASFIVPRMGNSSPATYPL